MAIKVLMWLVVLASLLIAGISVTGHPLPDMFPAGDAGTQGQLTAMPLQCIKNAGQSEDEVKYEIISDGGSIFFTPTGVIFKLVTRGDAAPGTQILGYCFAGANPNPSIDGVNPLEGRVNFLIGDDASRWLTGIPTYQGVRYTALYPGIDLIYEGVTGGLKSTYLVSPGSSPGDITLEYSGADDITIGEDGSLHISTPAGELIECPPVCYQEIDGRNVGISASYVLKGDNYVGFAIGPYDPSRPLVIDPVMKYGIYLRGTGMAFGHDVAVDSSRNVYVTGKSFPSPYTIFEDSFGVNGEGIDVVVVKISADGTSPIYVTYIGGSGDEWGNGIALDAARHAYITGKTDSTDFPTVNAIQDYLAGSEDAFVTKLSPDGSTIVFSTYLGGTEYDTGNAIVLDNAGNTYLTGNTTSLVFPVTNDRAIASYAGHQDAYILKMSGDGSQLFFSEFLGGTLMDAGYDVEVDSSGCSYVTGETFSYDFPVKDALKPEITGWVWSDAFVTKVNPTGDEMVFSTYIGGDHVDCARGIGLDSEERVYIAGATLSSDFPVVDAYQDSTKGYYDAFFTRISSDGSEIEYSTYLGGRFVDDANSIAVNPDGSAYITGMTQFSNFNLIDPYQKKYGGGQYDAYVAKFVPWDSTPQYLTYLGGLGLDAGWGIASDGVDGVYVTGYTDSSNFPTVDPYPVIFGDRGPGGFVTALLDHAEPPGIPVADFLANVTTGNAPLHVQFRDISTGYPTSWNWAFGDGATSTARNPLHVYAEPGVYTVTLTATNFMGSDTLTRPEYIVVTGELVPPVANFTAYPRSGIVPLLVQFTDTSTGIVDSWAWDFGDGTTSTLQNPTHTYTAEGNYTVTLTASNDAGESTHSLENFISVLPYVPPKPVADFTAAPTSGHVPLPVQFTDLSTGVVDSWLWDFGDGTTSTLQHPSHTYTMPGDYNVTLTVTNAGGSDTITKYAFIHISEQPSGPVADFTASPTTGCPTPLPVQFTDLSTGNPTSWYWQFGDGMCSILQNPQHIYNDHGTFNVSLTVVNADGSDTITKYEYITVCPVPLPPVANFTASPTSGQAPLSVQFTDLSTGIIDTWAWTFGDGETSSLQNPSHTYTSAGTYSVTLTVTNEGGDDSITKQQYITVSPQPVKPVADFTAYPTTGCPPPLSVQFTDTSANTPTSWYWQFGDGDTSTLQNPQHTYSANGTYSVTLTATNEGGSDTITKTNLISVCPAEKPDANFNYISECPNPLYAQFFDTSTGNPTSWYWQFGDGATSTEQNPTHTYPAIGGYEITLTVSNAAGSDYIQKVLCISCTPCPPVANFTYLSECPNPLDVRFTDTSSRVATEIPTAWYWQFGDGSYSTLQNPTHTYAEIRDYSVTLTASNAGGSNSITKTVHISSCGPHADFTYLSECPNPLDVQFTDTSTDNPTSWSWDFGDGSTSTLRNPLHTYTTISDYTVTLTASNADGSDSVTKTVHITPCAPDANFTYISECPNPLYVQFFDTSTGDPTSWYWQFGDGATSTEQNPTHTYTAIGGYEITLTVSNAGGSDYIQKVLCISCTPCPPVANFTYLSECPDPLNVRFTDTSSTIPTEIPTAWYWDFGDGTTSTLRNPTHTYAEIHDCTVTLTASNAGGSDSITKTVHITPCGPHADFTYVSECPDPLDVQFTDTSTDNPTSWYWQFGDGATSTLRNPAHTYTNVGDFSVTLTASNAGGSDSTQKTIHVPQCAPEANFTYLSECPNPLYVQFTDTSSDDPVHAPSSWFWSFGDGTYSTLQDPVHTYPAYGGYNITLTVSNEGGSDSYTQIVCLNPCPPVADFTYLSECPNPRDVQFTDTSSGNPTSWFWNFGDGETSSLQNPQHTYSSVSSYDVTLTATSEGGSAMVTKTVQITVCPDPPVACFWAFPVSGTAPLEVEFCDCSQTGILSWYWDFGDGNTSTLQNPTHIYAQYGDYTVTLDVTNATGSDTETKEDYVIVTSPPPSPPRAYFITNTTTGSVPLSVAFTDLSSGIPDTWLWNFGDGGTSDEQHPVHVYTVPGYYTVSLSVQNSEGSSTYTTRAGYITAN